MEVCGWLPCGRGALRVALAAGVRRAVLAALRLCWRREAVPARVSRHVPVLGWAGLGGASRAIDGRCHHSQKDEPVTRGRCLCHVSVALCHVRENLCVVEHDLHARLFADATDPVLVVASDSSRQAGCQLAKLLCLVVKVEPRSSEHLAEVERSHRGLWLLVALQHLRVDEQLFDQSELVNATASSRKVAAQCRDDPDVFLAPEVDQLAECFVLLRSAARQRRTCACA